MDTIRLASRNSHYREINTNDMNLCANASKEKDVTSLWGKIVDWFIGTKKEAAKIALFRLFKSETPAQQLSSFSELRQYVSPVFQNLLTWRFDSNNNSIFRIGNLDIPLHTTITGKIIEEYNKINIEEACHLLCSMTYSDHNVVTEFHRFAVGDLLDRNADSIHDRQLSFLNENPSLLRALGLLGLHKIDPDGNFANEIHQNIKRIIDQITSDDDKSAQAAKNAQNLLILASENQLNLA